jgi:hypothetical protein
MCGTIKSIRLHNIIEKTILEFSKILAVPPLLYGTNAKYNSPPTKRLQQTEASEMGFFILQQATEEQTKKRMEILHRN